MNFDDIRNAVQDIPTHTGPIQGRWLLELLSSIDPALPVCEVGTYDGYLTAVMAMAGRRVFQVDHMIGGWCDYAEGAKCVYLEVIDRMIKHGVWDKVVPLPMKSAAALEMFRILRPTFGLIYLDGDHSKDCVLMELQQFDEFIPIGGIVCGDDCVLQANNASYNPAFSFNRCWDSGMVEQFVWGVGVSGAVWTFFRDNMRYQSLPNALYNAFAFRKIA